MPQQCETTRAGLRVHGCFTDSCSTLDSRTHSRQRLINSLDERGGPGTFFLGSRGFIIFSSALAAAAPRLCAWVGVWSTTERGNLFRTFTRARGRTLCMSRGSWALRRGRCKVHAVHHRGGIPTTAHRRNRARLAS